MSENNNIISIFPEFNWGGHEISDEAVQDALGLICQAGLQNGTNVLISAGGYHSSNADANWIIAECEKIKMCAISNMDDIDSLFSDEDVVDE